MNETNEIVPIPVVPESVPQVPQTPVVTERKKRTTTEKQLAALKAGREKRWKLMFEALEKERNEHANTDVAIEAPKQSTMDPLLEVNSSEESESENDFMFTKSVQNAVPQRQCKYELSKVVRNRINEYVERKLYDSMYMQPQTHQLNKNVYEEQQQHQQLPYDYSRAYPSHSAVRTSYQFC